MKHPKPWIIEYDNYGGYNCMTSAYVIYDADGIHITEIDTGTSGPNDDAKETAENIVRSVNEEK